MSISIAKMALAASRTQHSHEHDSMASTKLVSSKRGHYYCKPVGVGGKMEAGARLVCWCGSPWDRPRELLDQCLQAGARSPHRPLVPLLHTHQ